MHKPDSKTIDRCMFPVISFRADKKQTTLNLTKEQKLKVVSAQCSQASELVTIDLSKKEDPAACTSTSSNLPTEQQRWSANLLCAAEKEKLQEEIEALKKKIAERAGKYCFCFHVYVWTAPWLY